jgi:hypothetical protein
MQQVKIVVFVPHSHAEAVRQALGDAGAGRIGLYSHCSYSVDGVGRFKPLAGAQPAIGEVGQFEEVEEERIECICERGKARQALEAIRGVHPYEEPAIDVYPLLMEEDLP